MDHTMIINLSSLSEIGKLAQQPPWRLRTKCQERHLPAGEHLTKDQLLFQLAFGQPAPPVTAEIELTVKP